MDYTVEPIQYSASKPAARQRSAYTIEHTPRIATVNIYAFDRQKAMTATTLTQTTY
jgi:hypothetical protein